ncbi:MAG: hypothetical protein WA987_02685 [Cellvibrio sp.]|jgi:tetratricopeptide (TPR) repeat protein
MNMKSFTSIVSTALNRTLLASVLAITPGVVTLVATSVAPNQTLIKFDVAEAQVKAKNKTFEPRRLPGVSQDFAKGLTEVGNQLQPPEPEKGGKAPDPNPRRALEILNGLARNKDKLNPYEQAQLYQFYAYAYYGLEDFKKARENFELVLRQSPNIPVSLEASTTLTIAQLYGNEENYRKALDMMLKWTDYVSEIKPEQYYLFGTLYYQLEDTQNAMLNINEAVRISEAEGKVPAESWYGLQRGLYFEREDYKNGVVVLEKLVRHYPKASYWRQLAQVYGILERDKQKLAALETAYLMGGVTSEKDLIILASYFLEAEVPYKAAKVLDKGINKDKSIEPTAKNLELLANSWRAAAEYNKSLVEMEKAARKSDDGNLLHTLATLYSLNDRYEDAIEAGNAALKKGKLKRRDQALLAIGNAELSLGKFDAAIKSFKEAAKDERSANLAKQYITFAEREKARVESLKQS